MSAFGMKSRAPAGPRAGGLPTYPSSWARRMESPALQRFLHPGARMQEPPELAEFVGRPGLFLGAGERRGGLRAAGLALGRRGLVQEDPGREAVMEGDHGRDQRSE